MLLHWKCLSTKSEGNDLLSVAGWGGRYGQSGSRGEIFALQLLFYWAAAHSVYTGSL